MPLLGSKSKHSAKGNAAPAPTSLIPSDLLDLLAIKAPQQWTISEVSAWLESIELGELRETFAENSISGAELLELGEDDMKTLGVSKLGHRKKLLRRIGQLRGDAMTDSSSHGHAGSINSSSAAESSENHDDPHGLERISFKCSFRGDWYSIRLTTSTTFRSLRRQLEEQFQCKLRVKYLDSDRDQVSMRREADFQACLAEADRKGRQRIKLYLYEKDQSDSRSSQGGGRSSLHASEDLATSTGSGHGHKKHSKSSNKKSQLPNLQLIADMFGMFEFILDPAVVINDKGIMLYVNKRVESVLGYTQAEMIGKNVDILTTEDIRPYHDVYLRNYLKTGVSRIIGKGRDVIAVKKDGTIIPVHLELTEKSTGSGLYFIGIMKEARNQVQEKSLIQMEREVLDNLSVPAVIIDHVGLINGFNKAAQEFLGYSLVDVIGKNINILMSSPHKELHDGYLKAYMETGVAKIIGVGRNVVAQHRDGTLIPIFLTVTEKRDKDKRFFTGVLQESRTATIAPIPRSVTTARGPPIVNL